MKNKKFKKIYSVLNFFLIGFLLFSQAGMAQAISVGDIMGAGSPLEFTNEILEGYGIDPSTVTSFGEVANVSPLKKTPPQVSLFFTPTNPSEGEKVTVTASPSYFMNNPKDLYFTWFLKSEGCTDKKLDKSKYDYNEKCDLDNDGEVDIEDYKIKAMRIIANGGFIISSDNIYKSSSDDDGYEASSGGNDQKGKDAYCYIRDTKSGKEYQLKYCGHLFPNAEYENFIDYNGNEINLDGDDEGKTGNGSFGRNEEKFWQTDPNSNDTSNRGNPDEATIAGLGITSFAWNYQKGDKVGVVVEGVSTDAPPTEDASYKTMWAMNNGMDDFDASLPDEEDYQSTTDEIISTTIDGLYTINLTKTTRQEIDGDIVNGIATIKTTVTMHNVTIVTATPQVLVTDVDVAETDDVPNPIITYSTQDFSGDYDLDDGEIEKPSDLNKFLYNSLVSPQENTPGSNKLDISLSYSPNNPINDPSGASGDGDLLTINSSVSNAKDTNYLQYDWKVYAGADISSDNWTLLLKPELFESTQSVGLGIDTFKFKLGLPDTNKYLKVVLTVTENTGEEYPRKSTQDVIIPINSTTEKIGVFDVLATDLTSTPTIDPDNLSRVKFDSGNEICNNDDLDKALCPVTKNQIIAVSVPAEHFLQTTNPDFLWTIDGKPFSYPYCFFKDCDATKQTHVAYFPVLKEVGEQYAVNLTATNNKGEKINITRNFQVVDPKITIRSADTKTCNQTVLGQYFDINGKSFPDYSQLNFWAYNNSNIKLEAVTTGFSTSPENLEWEIDGDSINSANASVYGYRIDGAGILTLKPKDKQGESYNISVGTLYTQNNLVKKALNAIWGVTYNQFYEKAVTDDAIITMQDPPETNSGSIKSKKIFATIYSSTPDYLAFLLRIVLTISLILFVTKLIFSFSPEISSREED
ncbi:MAG: hypothetical protein WC678_02245 [Parcubacteria group bacterium]|jgi:hypothetical protein